jgi:hypothetical protein
MKLCPKDVAFAGGTVEPSYGVIKQKPPESLPPPQLLNVKRPRGRFRETEFSRAVRGAIAAGAKGLELDPKTGVYRVILPGETESSCPARRMQPRAPRTS